MLGIIATIVIGILGAATSVAYKTPQRFIRLSAILTSITAALTGAAGVWCLAVGFTSNRLAQYAVANQKLRYWEDTFAILQGGIVVLLLAVLVQGYLRLLPRIISWIVEAEVDGKPAPNGDLNDPEGRPE